jgi:hypothetical protein
MYWNPVDRPAAVENRGCVGIVFGVGFTLGLVVFAFLISRLLGWL